MPSNYDAFVIYSLVQGQVLVGGMGDVIGLNHLAVWKDIDEYERECGIVNRWKIFNKIVKLFYHMQEKRTLWAEEAEEAKKKKEIEKKVGKEEAKEIYG